MLAVGRAFGLLETAGEIDAVSFSGSNTNLHVGADDQRQYERIAPSRQPPTRLASGRRPHRLERADHLVGVLSSGSSVKSRFANVVVITS
jgi:hypothetical protein